MLSELDALLGFSSEDPSPTAAVHHATAVLFGVPSMHDAALVHLAVAIGKACAAALKPTGSEDAEQQAELIAAIKVASETILHRVQTNSSVWAPILFEWSLKVLGEVSYTFGGESGEQMSDRIAYWRSCSATAPLLELAVQTMTHLMKCNPFTCMDTLLEAVRSLSPHLDWILALAAGMFSSSLVPALLRTGLKDFLLQYSSGSDGHGHSRSGQRKSGSRGSSPALGAPAGLGVMSGVVQILTHLLARHGQEICSALLQFFKDSVMGCSGTEEVLVTVPYLLHLMLECPRLLQLIMRDIIACLSPVVQKVLYSQYCQRAAKWNNSREMENVRSLLKLLRSDLEPILQLLFQLASPSKENALPKPAQESLYRFLEQFLDDLQFSVFRRVAQHNSADRDDPPVFLLSLQPCSKFLLDRVLPADSSHSPCALSYQLLVLTGLCAGKTWCANLLSTILLCPPSFRNHSLFVDLHKVFNTVHNFVLDPCLSTLFAHMLLFMKQAESQSLDKALAAVVNLKALCVHERENTFAPRCSMNLAQSLASHAPQLCSYARLASCGAAMREACLELLHLFPSLCATPHTLASVSTSTACARSLVACYAGLCPGTAVATNGVGDRSCTDSTTSLFRQSAICCDVMSQLAAEHVGMQPFLLRHLMEAGIAPGANPATSNGAVRTNGSATNSGCGNRVSLLEDNYHRTSTGGYLAAGASGSAGLVKTGLRERQARNSVDSNQSCQSTAGEYSNECVQLQDHYTRALCAVAQATPPPPPASANAPAPSSGLPTLASILIDIVSAAAGVVVPPTVASLWPEEEALKYTQKSDLDVRHCFEEHPIMWQALFLVTQDPQTFSMVCPILRSLLANQVMFWRRWKLVNVANCQKELRMSRDLLYLMSKAGWLPKQVLQGSNILMVVSSAEVYSILSACWTHLRLTWEGKQPDNIASAAKSVTAILTGIVTDNMDTLGHFYHLLS